ncbi:MAG: S1/P1 Nuclease [Bacteroidia bacterium]|nr:S1/P1 Nuclease [Bacteroidia bacterium]
MGILLPLIIAPGAVITLLAWGFWGHQQINKAAVFTLPPELFGFYKEHIAFITAHAVDADKRRYADPAEAPRHFIDLDRYGDHPFDSLPRRWEEAVAKYGEDSLQAHGIVPWHVMRMLARLTKAFREHDRERILRYSADIGHYIGDAHVPLHCTRNYNGQLSGQHGIHGFWESRLPELFGDQYDRITGRASYLQHPSEVIWQVLRESYAAHDSVLRIEKQLAATFSPDQRYTVEERGGQLLKVYSKQYSAAYHQALHGMVERRFQAAIHTVGSFWYTAWVDAGMPAMNYKGEFILSAEAKDELDSLDLKYNSRSGTVAGHED